MRVGISILLAAFFAAPCFAGTNVTVRVIEDDHTDTRWQVYSHGTTEVLKIHRRGKKTSVTSKASGYSVTHSDDDGDGVTDSIMISEVNGGVLEVLKRSKDGAYSQTPQDDLDEMNEIVKKIEARLPKRKR
jgi:regulator of RNase E activity RraA